MVAALSTLASLEGLALEFQCRLFRLYWKHRPPPPPTRSVLSVLTSFHFKGDSEYLDDFMAHINAPQLNDLNITLFNDIIFDTPQFFQFICRAPRLAAPKDSRVIFNDFIAGVDLISTDYNLYLK